MLFLLLVIFMLHMQHKYNQPSLFCLAKIFYLDIIKNNANDSSMLKNCLDVISKIFVRGL